MLQIENTRQPAPNLHVVGILGARVDWMNQDCPVDHIFSLINTILPRWNRREKRQQWRGCNESNIEMRFPDRTRSDGCQVMLNQFAFTAATQIDCTKMEMTIEFAGRKTQQLIGSLSQFSIRDLLRLQVPTHEPGGHLDESRSTVEQHNRPKTPLQQPTQQAAVSDDSEDARIRSRNEPIGIESNQAFDSETPVKAVSEAQRLSSSTVELQTTSVDHSETLVSRDDSLRTSRVASGCSTAEDSSNELSAQFDTGRSFSRVSINSSRTSYSELPVLQPDSPSVLVSPLQPDTLPSLPSVHSPTTLNAGENHASKVLDPLAPSSLSTTVLDTTLAVTLEDSPTAGREISSVVNKNDPEVISPVPDSGSRIFIPIASNLLYDLGDGIYQHQLGTSKLPTELEHQWRNKICPELISNLSSAITNVRFDSEADQIFTPDFCLLGKSAYRSQYICLQPTVLIRCSSEKGMKIIKNACADLSFLEKFNNGRYHVCLGATLWASQTSSSTPIERPNESPIHPDISASEKYYTACGLTVIFGDHSTHGPGQNQSCSSTIGGIIEVGGEAFGLTTSHGLMFASHRKPSSASSQTTPVESLRDVKISISKSDSESTSPPRITLLNRRECLGPWGFLKRGQISGPDLQNHGAVTGSAVDFALLRLRQERHTIRNEYQLPGSVKPTLIHHIEANPTSGNVNVILKYNNIASGQLVEGNSSLIMGATIFETRRIWMNTPLSMPKHTNLGVLC